jgi:hypothetical protein
MPILPQIDVQGPGLYQPISISQGKNENPQVNDPWGLGENQTIMAECLIGSSGRFRGRK